MAFRTKLLLTLLLAVALPVALTGWLSYDANRTELLQSAQKAQQLSVQELAAATGAELMQQVENLKASAAVLQLDELSPEEAEAVLQIPFQQYASLSAVVVLDTNGQPVTRTVSERTGRSALTAESLGQFGARIPASSALSVGAAVGAPYQRDGKALVAVAVRAGETRLLAAELELSELTRRVVARGTDGFAYVADANGLPLADSRGAGAAIPPQQLSAGARSIELQGERFLLAVAPIAELGWTAVVAQREAVALAPAERVKRYTLFWTAFALLVALGTGLLLARAVSSPLLTLSTAVKGMAEGRYDQHVAVSSGDEVGALSEAFNRMVVGIRQRDEEIRAFNQQLQARVEERTRELREAQEQVQRGRRLATLGTLAAGIAHELNNPLQGVIGMLEIMQMDLAGHPAQKLIAIAESDAHRIAAVVAKFREVAESQAHTNAPRLRLDQPVTRALDAAAATLKSRKVEVVTEFDAKAPEIRGDPKQLETVVAQLLQNAVTAMPSGGRITLGIKGVGSSAAKILVQDTGKGIPNHIRERIFDPFFTTKEEPGRLGMGLTLAARIVDDHHGKIVVDSEPGKGSTFSVILPAAEEAHLV